MKKVLGLDLGVSSIGWALINVDDNDSPQEILGMGSRIVPLSTDDSKEFTSGNAISKNQKRTIKRTIRKGYDRYQQRRQNLTEKLRELGMLPDEKLIKLPVLELWQLRADAATPNKMLTLPEIGRVLYHLNQKRGYKHSKFDDASDSKQKDYVANINKRYADIQEMELTIGQFFVKKLKESEVVNETGKFYTYRTKEQVFPRAAYIAEFDQIMKCQQQYYPTVLTDNTISEIRNNIIYYQRGLKSCKHLVSLCEFEKRNYVNKEGKVVQNGPKVAPKSSPLFQICKIWESVNNITLTNRRNEKFPITVEQRKSMAEFLNNHEKMGLTDMYKILGIKKSDGWWGGKAIGKGLSGNTTKCALKKALADSPNAEELLSFNLKLQENGIIDTETGEMIKEISPSFLDEPLYRLWHAVYSINNSNELSNTLKKQFGISNPDIITNLSNIDFIKPGFGNKSARFIRRILPYLQDGFFYSEACDIVGINHSGSLTKDENQARELLSRLPQIQKNELRQPVVEKILNQMINVVNALLDKYGSIDEIRVELARELKESKDERANTFKRNNENQRNNEKIEQIIKEYGIRPSKSRIQKYKLWEESEHRCFYCGQSVSAKEFLEGLDVEIEHIIPKSLLFDDSFSNKVCSCRECNARKGQHTAYDFMKNKEENTFNNYLTKVDEFFQKGKISKTKRDRLLTPYCGIPQDFIDRQLRESQYISKKSRAILSQICHNVWTTSGNVTSFLRHIWGYDNVLHTLNFNRYKKAGLTEIVVSDHKGVDFKEERIKDWSKRLDHRHHAIDALIIAETRQAIIQRLNSLNAEHEVMHQEVISQSTEWQEKKSLLEQWAILQPHFSVSEVTEKTDSILVSFKPGKKVATTGNRSIQKQGKQTKVQTGIIIPRGPLSEESVYGKIKTIEKGKPIKYLFENPELIVDTRTRSLIEQRLSEHDGDIKSALRSIKNKPIYAHATNTIQLEYATCYKNEYVIKYPLTSLKAKDVPSIVDNHIRHLIENRLSEYNGNEKEAFRHPLFADKNNHIEIKSIRLFTGLTAVTPVKYDDGGKPIGYVLPKNNHHVAFYKDDEGIIHEHIVTFWHAVERKKYGIPVVIGNTTELWDSIINKDLPQDFLAKLPSDGLELICSMQNDEMFIMGLSDEELDEALTSMDYKTINKHLYRVRGITEGDYTFRLHTDTRNDVTPESCTLGNRIRVKSIGSFFKYNPKKVHISVLGEYSNS